MRGQQERTGCLFSYVSIEDRIPTSHPLRRIRKLADQVLDRLNPTFCQLYASAGRPSVPPEQLLLASLLQAFDAIRSKRLLLEQLAYNLIRPGSLPRPMEAVTGTGHSPEIGTRREP